jgi:2-amino-4-hydroxy-6-hydroxymethyldihydropteridine diphosphokinase
MSADRIPVGIALGSNLGDRAAEIEAGFTFLRSLSTDGRIRRSTVIETAPVDCPPGSAPFLNAVAELLVDPGTCPPDQFHSRLKQFETERGRPPEHARNGPRSLDLDLLYFGDLVLDTPELTLPHPRAVQRRFVLGPLAELRPDLRLPGQTRTVLELLESGAPSGSALNYGMTSREDIGKVEQLAYKLWERDGRPEGQAVVYWIRAERLLSEDAFLKHELEVEVEEGGIVPETRKLPPLPFPSNP